MRDGGYVMSQKAGLAFFQSLNLAAFDFVTHAFCTRLGGLSAGPYGGLNLGDQGGDDPARVEGNWQTLARAFDIPRKTFFPLRQVHGNGVLVLDGHEPRAGGVAPPDGDAVITDRPGLALCIRTADCVPILLLDQERRVVAAVHAGWKGTAQKITIRTVEVMVDRFASVPMDLVAAVGPAVGPCCYEVDEPVVAALGGPGDAFCKSAERKDRWMLDLPGLNEAHLLAAGLRPEGITRMDLCTACRPDLFFSHRRDGERTGRHVHFISLVEQPEPNGPK